MEEKRNTANSENEKDTTPKEIGIGGIFFFSDNPEKSKEWYSKNLGLATNEWGSSLSPEMHIDQMRSTTFNGAPLR